MSDGPVTEAAEVAPVEHVVDEVADVALAVESTTPGAVLRRAREARGQSIADVVQVIRFSARQIEALERDDYASLPGSTAVRGLVRNYAKFLKLDAVPLLAQLEPSVPVPEADVRPPTNIGDAEKPTIVDSVPPKYIAAGIALLVMVLAGYWYATSPGEGRITSLLRGMSLGTPGNTGGAVTAVPVVQPAPAVVAESAPAAAGDAAVPLPFVGLRVEFDDRSWIEVRDAAQKVLFVGEHPAGTRQNIEGKPPFHIWIGKASGVRVFMGERSIDLKPHIREEVARFTLE